MVAVPGVASVTAAVAPVTALAAMCFVVVARHASGVVAVGVVLHLVAVVHRVRAGPAVGRRCGSVVLSVRRHASNVALVIVVCVRICHHSAPPRPDRPQIVL